MGVINTKKEIAIGVLVSIFATIGGLFIYLQYISRYGFYETLEMAQTGGLMGAVIALGSIPNLFVFFVFLKKNQDYRARGVLIATMFIALITFVLKFI